MSDLLGNGRTFEVPKFQRDYSWTEEQWEDLWNDILDLLKQPDNPNHYMGAIVLETTDSRKFTIIDGQQRIATLSILALAIISCLQKLTCSEDEKARNAERSSLLRSKYIGDKKLASLVETSKLTLNEKDNGFYQDYLVQLRSPHNPRGLSKSNKLLWDCFTYFSARISDTTNLKSGAALTDFFDEIVARRLSFIQIIVDSELNAYTVFETLNARGLELSTTDLLKNYLFSRVKAAHEISSLNRRWNSLMETVKQERFPDFLRYYLLCYDKDIRKNRLYKIVRNRIVTLDDLFNLIDALEARAEVFAAIFDSQHQYWTDRSDCIEYIQALNLFKVKQMTPLLFVAWDRMSQSDFTRVLKFVTAIHFRYNIVCKLNPNKLDSAYHKAASELMRESVSSPKDVFKILKNEAVYVSDSDFEQRFASLTFEKRSNDKLVKYILSNLETGLSKRNCDPYTDPATIEHVLPENPTDNWNTISPDKWDEAVSQVGNLTLLEKNLNKKCGNNPFIEKLACYAQSKYALSKHIYEMGCNEWTLDLIKKRGKMLAKKASQIWRFDFD